MTTLSRALLLSALLATASPVAVLAAETPDTPADASAPDTAGPPATGVKELVVKAARQETPASAEAVTAAEISETVNAVNVEDTLKYLPSLLVRKRHIGDTFAPLATRTNGVGGSARTLIYADGILLSALIGNNNGSGSPRWGLVDPSDVSSVTFLYGPFSAAYAGNSIGGVLNIRTSIPDRLEGSVKAVGSWQSFKQYATDDDYRSGQLSASIGDRLGNFWFRASGNLVESNGQPLSYVTGARATAPSAAGTVVTGPFADVNRTNAPIAVFGASGLEHQVQSNLNLKLGYDLPFATAAYTIGRFGNNTDSHVETYTRDSGAPVYAGTVSFGGYAYTLANSAFSGGVYSLDEAHWAQSLSLASRGDGPWSWNLAASLYDFTKDETRNATTAIPNALVGGAGTITRLNGTGWRTLEGSMARTWGRNTLSFGVHDDEVELNSSRYLTTDWRIGSAGALNQQSLGKTRAGALWAQDAYSFSDDLKLTVGARYEDWKAYDGFNFSSSPVLSVNQPELTAKKTSPKATLEWAPAGGWSVSASYGEAYRFPTVTELYQAISTTTGGVTTLSVPNPTLRPEHARSAELAVERSSDSGRVRISLFSEDISDALISQTAPLVVGSPTLYSYVQNVDRTQVNGVEVVAERSNVFINGLDLSASATWTDPTIRRDTAFPTAVGKQIPGVPKFKATVVATWRPNDKWSWTVAGRYSDRVYASIDNSDVVTHTYQGFDSFVVVDTRVAYRIDKSWEAALGVDNVGDRRYFLFHPFPGRTVQAELNFKF